MLFREITAVSCEKAVMTLNSLFLNAQYCGMHTEQ